MAGGTGILMAASSGTTTITADTGPYRWICTASHGLETSNGTTEPFYILLMPRASVWRTTEVIAMLQIGNIPLRKGDPTPISGNQKTRVSSSWAPNQILEGKDPWYLPSSRM